MDKTVFICGNYDSTATEIFATQQASSGCWMVKKTNKKNKDEGLMETSPRGFNEVGRKLDE